MTTVTQGNTGTYTFAVNEMATLTLTGSQQARVEVTDGATGKVKYGAASSVSETFGPFLAGDVLSITAMRGSVVYTISTYVPSGGTGITTLATATDYTTNLVTPLAGKIGVPQGWDGTNPALVSSTNPVPAFGTNAFIYNGATSATLDGLTFNPTDMALFVGGVYTKIILGGGYVGSFATAAALQTASPAASNPACTAIVTGGPTPGFYVSNGTAWAMTDGATLSASIAANAAAIAGKEPITTIGTTGNQTLTAAQNNQVIPTSGASVITVNTGLGVGFGCAFVGAGVVTFAGSATVTDKRTTGATNPACSLVPTGTDVYSVIGSKA